MSSNISSHSIANIYDFLSVDNRINFAQTNKDYYKIYKQKQEEEIKKLKKFIKTHFPTKLLSTGFKYESIYRIQNETKNPVTTLLMTCIDKHLQSENYVTLIKYNEWIKRGYPYSIAYKYLSLGYKVELLYFPHNMTYDIIMTGGSNIFDVRFSENNIKKIKKGKFQTIFQAFDIILDNNKLDKYLRK